MKRRTFLKQGVAAGVLLAGLPRVERLAEANEAKWRSFEVTTKIEVVDTAGVTRAWIPVPLMVDTDYFRRQGADTWKGNAATSKLYRDEKYDAGFVYAEWPAAEKAPALEIVSRFSTRDRFVDVTKPPVGTAKEDPAVLRKYLEATKLHPDRRHRARHLHDDHQGTERGGREGAGHLRVDRGQHLPRSEGEGLRPRRRQDDARDALSRRQVRRPQRALSSGWRGRRACRPATSTRARCADSAEFKSLGKSGDISKAQHCRAEVFLTGYGWVPVDPADVRKVVLEEKAGGIAITDPQALKARGKLFGAWEMNWMAYNYAHDLKLPNSTGKPVPFLMYPQAEVGDERKDSLDPATFKYTIVSRELT